MARISYTEKEVELLARLIKSEALGEGEEGMLLVGNVVVNRVVANPSLEVITIFFRTTFKPFLSICRFYRLFLYF